VRLTVSDNGIGMSDETIHHIFEPLYTTKATGTGLGLAVTHQIVKRHAGEIFVESREGKGTSFHLFLPRTEAEEAAEGSSVLPFRKPARHTRVLLVEDDAAVSEGLLAALEEEGLEVSAVDRGALAVDAVRRVSPDAVVLDVGLPDMSGADVYLQIAEEWPDLPVIFSTGHGDMGRLERFLERPNVDYLMKPYGTDVLLERLSRLVRRG
jgi:CheY-like chemotaxis protein